MNTGASEGLTGEKRFRFGKNWRAFLASLNEERIREAEESLQEMLELHNLKGRRFLDIGSGSGIFSLAARRLGAEVHSFDFDVQSVACTRELKKRFFGEDSLWEVEEGSILDQKYLRSLGKFDLVYAWGVLHHTGNLKQAMENVVIPIAPKGTLFLSIYNDQGLASSFWGIVKKTYCSGLFGKASVRLFFIPCFVLKGLFLGVLKHGNPFGYFSLYKKRRGMSPFHDWIDWLGGFPFEVASVESIFRFYRDRGFILREIKTTNRLGCNQFVFRRESRETLAGAAEDNRMATAGR